MIARTKRVKGNLDFTIEMCLEMCFDHRRKMQLHYFGYSRILYFVLTFVQLDMFSI